MTLQLSCRVLIKYKCDSKDLTGTFAKQKIPYQRKNEGTLVTPTPGPQQPTWGHACRRGIQQWRGFGIAQTLRSTNYILPIESCSRHLQRCRPYLTLYVPNLSEGTKTYICILCHFSLWRGTGNWNPSSWKTMACLFHRANIMAAHDLAPYVARASAGIILT